MNKRSNRAFGTQPAIIGTDDGTPITLPAEDSLRAWALDELRHTLAVYFAACDRYRQAELRCDAARKRHKGKEFVRWEEWEFAMLDERHDAHRRLVSQLLLFFQRVDSTVPSVLEDLGGDWLPVALELDGRLLTLGPDPMQEDRFAPVLHIVDMTNDHDSDQYDRS